ncbi:hypothetical protein D3C79_1084880 [compost metagenome]
MPDNGVLAVTGIDAQLSLPSRIVQLHIGGVGEHPLTAAMDLQGALLATGLTVQTVVALNVF